MAKDCTGIFAFVEYIGEEFRVICGHACGDHFAVTLASEEFGDKFSSEDVVMRRAEYVVFWLVVR